jgi:hypothetical protein
MYLCNYLIDNVQEDELKLSNKLIVHNLWQPTASEIGVILFYHDIWPITPKVILRVQEELSAFT